jgi:hypothetical protein
MITNSIKDPASRFARQAEAVQLRTQPTDLLKLGSVVHASPALKPTTP